MLLPRMSIRTVHAAFAASLGLVAILAAWTALRTAGPWFSGGPSMEVYSTSLLAAILISLGVTGIASARVREIDAALRGIDLRIAQIPEAIGMPKPGEVGADFVRMIPPSDDDVDELLTTLAATPHGESVQAEIEYTGTLVEVSTALTAGKTRKELLKALLGQRAELEAARVRVAPTVGVPLAATFLVAFASGAMLPGSEGFALAHFQLNTGVVLFLSYGWAFLAGWIAVALGLVHARRA